MRQSEALNAGEDGIADYLDKHIHVQTHTNGKRNALGEVLDGIRQSAADLRISDELLWLAIKLPPYEFKQFLLAVTEQEAVFESFAGEFGKGALRRAATSANRLVELLRVLSRCAPPPRSAKYLRSATTCYLLGLDREAVAMCRAAVEVLVEELDQNAQGTHLGKAIKSLRESGRLPRPIAADMFAINDQAKEVLHDEVARHPVNATDCLERLSRVLAGVFPAG